MLLLKIFLCFSLNHFIVYFLFLSGIALRDVTIQIFGENFFAKFKDMRDALISHLKGFPISKNLNLVNIYYLLPQEVILIFKKLIFPHF